VKLSANAIMPNLAASDHAKLFGIAAQEIAIRLVAARSAATNLLAISCVAIPNNLARSLAAKLGIMALADNFTRRKVS